MLGKIGAILGLASMATHEAERTISSGVETYQLPITREEALKKRKSRKAQKAQKKARRANRVRR